MEESGDRQLLNLFVRDAVKIPLMTREEEILEARKAIAGDIAARNRLVTANLRFVLSMAFRYRRSGVPLMDLVSAGCLGTLVAAGKFDPDVGVRFITYAGHWIQQGVLSTIAGNDDPRTISLDTPVNSDDQLTINDVLAADERPFENALSDLDFDQLLAYPSVLTDRERRCLGLRYRDDMTLKRTGEALGITKNRTSEIETRALYKLRRFLHTEGMRENHPVRKKLKEGH